MNQLDLSPEERETLHDVVQRSLAELEKEILHTDHAEFKSLLKHRKEVLSRLSARLAVTRGVGASP